jgi:hypothetical protein
MGLLFLLIGEGQQVQCVLFLKPVREATSADGVFAMPSGTH